MYEGPGEYIHYKGGRYQVFGLSVNEELKDELGDGFDLDDDAQVRVVYQPLTAGSLLDGTRVGFWSRPLPNFNETVDLDCFCSDPTHHDLVPRFRKLK